MGARVDVTPAAAENIIPSTVELGGKSPNIFFADIMKAEPAFIEKAAEGLVLAFFNQGEVCTCPSRALVEESIYDDFMKVVMLTTGPKISSWNTRMSLVPLSRVGWM